MPTASEWFTWLRRSHAAVTGQSKLDLPTQKGFAGRPVLLVDDIVSSGGTLMACAEALAAATAKTIDVIIAHALFPAEMAGEFVRAGIRSIRSTNSVPHPTNAIMLDDIFVAALRNEMSGAGCPERTS